MDSSSDTNLFDGDLLELLGLGNLPDDQKQEFYTIVMDTIQSRVLARVLDSLVPDDKKAFDDLLGASEQEKLAEFLKARDIDLNALMLQEALIYKAEVVTLAQPFLAKRPDPSVQPVAA